MSCEPRVYENINADQFAKITMRAQNKGIDISGTAGSCNVLGCGFHWLHDGNKLIIQCTHVSWLTSCEHVNKLLDELMQA